ncbi:SURF1 family protein [Neptuniibacter caesariensis]|uniref:SURF1-like protein n=1 Tax=Neptuniibacter caesariensis TaxID=207954 RepID=A0A7U8C4G5_NEPCE|nr:SURF1 family protein [Neptuniibacter caesariensis]EAR61365.1 hypothetical protein MED92_17703 [Oceanospirillum sp. MED92] [Neptuniibacter caesariensis]
MSKVQSSQGFKYLLIIALLVLLPLLVGLGFWQLGRAEQKSVMLMNLQQAEVMEWGQLMQKSVVDDYLPVRVSGMFDQQRYFLLDNRTRGGAVGYEVIGILELSNGEAIAINAGWVKAGADRRKLPEVDFPVGVQVLIGSITHSGRGFVLSEQLENSHWPIVIQRLNTELISKMLGHKVEPFEVKLKERLLPELNVEWPITGMTSARHTAYAFQWFSMALALGVMIGLGWYRVIKEQRNE